MSQGEVSGKDSQDFTSCLNMLLFIWIKKYKKEIFKKKQVIADISNYWLNNLLEWIVVTHTEIIFALFR